MAAPGKHDHFQAVVTLQQLRWDQAFVRRDSARLRLWIILRTFVVLARPETVYGEAGKNFCRKGAGNREGE